MEFCEECGMALNDLNESQPVCPACGSAGCSDCGLDFGLDFDELGLDDTEAGLEEEALKPLHSATTCNLPV
jgi:hypothetical protein